MYCVDCTVSVPPTENAPAGSERDLRRGTHLPVPEERGDVPTRGGCPGCGAGTGWGESGAGKFLEFSQLDLSLCCRRGARSLEGFSMGNKGQRRGLFPGARIHSQDEGL